MSPGTTSPRVPRAGGGNGLGRRPEGPESLRPAGDPPPPPPPPRLPRAAALEDHRGRAVPACRSGPSRSRRLTGAVGGRLTRTPDPQYPHLWNGGDRRGVRGPRLRGPTGSHGSERPSRGGAVAVRAPDSGPEGTRTSARV